MWKRKLLWTLLLGSAMAVAQTGVGPKPATEGCPWITQGSAARALGGDVTVTVAVTSSNDGSCVFSRPPQSLEIMVSEKPVASCPAGSAQLKGVGNEAFRCSPPSARGTEIEMISSRVRNIFFVVSLSSQGRRSAKPDDVLEQIAEQVAGSLY